MTGYPGTQERVRAPASAWSAAGTSLLEFVLSLLVEATSTALPPTPRRTSPIPRQPQRDIRDKFDNNPTLQPSQDSLYTSAIGRISGKSWQP